MVEHIFIIRVKTGELADAERTSEDQILDSVTHAITESLEFIKPAWNLDDVLVDVDNVLESDEPGKL